MYNPFVELPPLTGQRKNGFGGIQRDLSKMTFSLLKKKKKKWKREMPKYRVDMPDFGLSGKTFQDAPRRTEQPSSAQSCDSLAEHRAPPGAHNTTSGDHETDI